MVAKLLAIGAAFVVNFAMSHFVVFRKLHHIFVMAGCSGHLAKTQKEIRTPGMTQRI